MYEKEAIKLYQKLIRDFKSGDWEYSPVENWKPDYFKENLTEQNLKNFKNNKLSQGLKADWVGQTAVYRDDIGRRYNSILEVGAGFGELCWLMDRPKYFIVDLPENLALTYYYLKEKGMNVKLFEGTADEKGVYLVAPWDLPKLNEKIDLFINTMSFQHMTFKNIAYYLNEVGRLKIPKLYLVNRDYVRDETDVKMSDYPIPKDYQLIKSNLYPYADHLINIYQIHEK